MRLLLSKKEGELLVTILENHKAMSRDRTMVELLLERIRLCLQLQGNESKSKS